MNKIVSLNVNIPHPCAEVWENMYPLERGKFCNHCSKKVIDFSFMSDAEIVRTMAACGAGVCGRYREDQLNRELFIKKEKGHSLMPAIMLSTLLTAGTVASSSAKGISVEMVQADTTLTPPGLPADTIQNLAGYSALGRDFEVKEYLTTRTRFHTGMIATVYTIQDPVFKAKSKRKWFQFWKRR
jgi:hypothetical protein